MIQCMNRCFTCCNGIFGFIERDWPSTFVNYFVSQLIKCKC